MLRRQKTQHLPRRGGRICGEQTEILGTPITERLKNLKTESRTMNLKLYCGVRLKNDGLLGYPIVLPVVRNVNTTQLIVSVAIRS